MHVYVKYIEISYVCIVAMLSRHAAHCGILWQLSYALTAFHNSLTKLLFSTYFFIYVHRMVRLVALEALISYLFQHMYAVGFPLLFTRLSTSFNNALSASKYLIFLLLLISTFLHIYFINT